jgi:hypothetical protein
MHRAGSPHRLQRSPMFVVDGETNEPAPAEPNVQRVESAHFAPPGQEMTRAGGYKHSAPPEQARSERGPPHASRKAARGNGIKARS